MARALDLAVQAESIGEVPVGAVLILDGQIIGEGHNQPISLHDPTAHAEILALRDGARRIENYRLAGTSLYSTLEPCVMCWGAIIHARVARVVFGAVDPKSGALGGWINLGRGEVGFNHRPVWGGGVLAEESRRLLQQFFRQRRGSTPPARQDRGSPVE